MERVLSRRVDVSSHREIESNENWLKMAVRYSESHRMAEFVIQLDDHVVEKLRRRARHGRSVEEEVREMLREAVRGEESVRAPLGSRIADRFRRVGLAHEIPELRGQPESARFR
jgi:plasmid stability protein